MTGQGPGLQWVRPGLAHSMGPASQSSRGAWLLGLLRAPSTPSGPQQPLSSVAAALLSPRTSSGRSAHSSARSLFGRGDTHSGLFRSFRDSSRAHFLSATTTVPRLDGRRFISPCDPLAPGFRQLTAGAACYKHPRAGVCVKNGLERFLQCRKKPRGGEQFTTRENATNFKIRGSYVKFYWKRATPHPVPAAGGGPCDPRR